MATIDPNQDYDIIYTLTFSAASGTCPIRLYRGSVSTISRTVYYRAGTSGDWTSLSVSGSSTTFPVTSTTMQVAHSWNKSGNNYMTPSFQGATNITSIAISQKSFLTGIIGNCFMHYYAQNCSSLTSLDVPGTISLTSVGNAFMYSYAHGCSKLTSLDVPDTSGVTSVGTSFMASYARSCSKITSLAVPDTSSLASVGNSFMHYYAYGCSSLTKLVLPAVGWFENHNVSWNVPSGRLGVLEGHVLDSDDLNSWKALTAEGKTLYTNYIRNPGLVYYTEYCEYVADLIRTIIQSQSYNADTKRPITQSQTYQADTFRKVNKEYSYPADAERKIAQDYDYVADTFRKVLEICQYPADARRIIIRTDAYNADLLRRIVKQYEYAADTMRFVVELGVCVGDTYRVVRADQVYSADALRQAIVDQVYSADALRQAIKEYEHIADTKRATIKEYIFTADTLRKLKSPVWIPLGTFWTLDDWDAPDDSLKATVTARDRLELLRKGTYQSSQVLTNVSLGALAELVFQDAGLVPSEYHIDAALYLVIVPYAWFQPVSHREALRLIAEAGLAVVYCDREGIVRMEVFGSGGEEVAMDFASGRDYFRTRTPINPSRVINEVIVTTQPLRPSETAQEVYRSNEPISIAASQTLSVIVHYNAPPVIEAVASLESPPAGVSITDAAYYGWGAKVEIHNTSGATQQVTLVISGKPLSVMNRERAVARDEQSIIENAVLRYEFPANHLIQVLSQAQSIADTLLASAKDPRRDIEIEWRGNPALLLGDRIRIKGVDYMVTANDIEWAGYLRETTTGRRVV